MGDLSFIESFKLSMYLYVKNLVFLFNINRKLLIKGFLGGYQIYKNKCIFCKINVVAFCQQMNVVELLTLIILINVYLIQFNAIFVSMRETTIRFHETPFTSQGSTSLGKNSIRSSKFVETTSSAIESNSL